MQVQFLGWEDPLEKEMATHCSIFAWEILERGAWWATVFGVAKSRLSTHNHTHNLYIVHFKYHFLKRIILKSTDDFTSLQHLFGAPHKIPVKVIM